MNKKKKRIFTREDKVGLLFTFPFILGFIFLFMKPLIQSTIYSFHRVFVNPDGLALEPVGLENYRRALLGDGAFIRTFLSAYGGILVKTAFIILFSMFMALLLNQEFKGRLLFRTIAFLPVIFASERALEIMGASNMLGALSSESNEFLIVSESGIEFLNEIMESFGFGSGMIELFGQYIDNIFGVAWDSGIPIVLFIIGLRSIPDYLYEVCDIEGATKWESFWKITFPMLSPTILLCIIYSLIVEFNSGNAIIKMILNNKTTQIHYSCAQSWIYSIVIFVTVAVIYKLISKRTVYFD